MPEPCAPKDQNAFNLPPVWDVPSTVALLEKGLPVSSFAVLSREVGVSEKTLAELMRISPRTIYRRKKEGTFPLEEGERVLRYVRIVQRAIEVFGDKDRAKRWLGKPNALLQGKTPLAFAETEPGAGFVMQVMGRLEHGVFS